MLGPESLLLGLIALKFIVGGLRSANRDAQRCDQRQGRNVPKEHRHNTRLFSVLEYYRQL